MIIEMLLIAAGNLLALPLIIFVEYAGEQAVRNKKRKQAR